jgi:hypothetical protein
MSELRAGRWLHGPAVAARLIYVEAVAARVKAAGCGVYGRCEAVLLSEVGAQLRDDLARGRACALDLVAA